MRRRGQRGQALAEYALVLAFMLAFVFTPMLPHPDGGTVSLFFLFIEAFDIYINSFHTVITLPIP